MIALNENFIILDSKNCPDNLKYIDFNLKTTYSHTNSALKINFKDENELSYLNGKSFEVKDVPFAKDIK